MVLDRALVRKPQQRPRIVAPRIRNVARCALRPDRHRLHPRRIVTRDVLLLERLRTSRSASQPAATGSFRNGAGIPPVRPVTAPEQSRTTIQCRRSERRSAGAAAIEATVRSNRCRRSNPAAPAHRARGVGSRLHRPRRDVDASTTEQWRRTGRACRSCYAPGALTPAPSPRLCAIRELRERTSAFVSHRAASSSRVSCDSRGPSTRCPGRLEAS